MIKQTLSGAWQFRQAGSDEWLPARVPGGVHTDLLAAGRIPDPFAGDNEKRVQWVAESDWEYRQPFVVDADLLNESQVFLVCDGLDTLTEVMLNGQLIASTDNMYRQYRWAVKSWLHAGENELRITFHSPVKYVTDQEKIRTLPGVGDLKINGASHLRKAPSHFGWDWGPMLPPIGIWKDIRLEASVARLADVHVRQQHTRGQVSVSALATVEAQDTSRISDASSLRVTMTITAPDGRPQSIEGPVDQTLVLPIDRPQLWWPNDFGAQPLYQVEVKLLQADAELDRRIYAIGLRTLELRQQPDEWGRSFTFVVNGVPIFAKGSNWIPADSFPTRIAPEQLEHLIRSAAEAHHNMLRVWGGGLYEDEYFYDLCDRYGILVWQDFMFACAGYPLHEEAFLATVKVEVEQAVRRLRQHACLALWCGNNEMEGGWTQWGWNKPENADLKAADRRFFYHILPQWVKANDPDSNYWPSSPSSNMPHEATESDAVGDTHVWEVWHGLKPFSYYRERVSRFVSEFGFQSLPALATIATYAEPSEWNMTSYLMEHHQRHTNGNGKIITYLTQHFQLAKDFPSLVYLTQVLQAEAMRIGVEHWRRHRDRCSGALYWQLNDCWPVASWSSIDYAGRWKALQYASRRFYAPVLLSIEDNGDRMNVFVTNDTPDTWQGEVRWSLETVRGETRMDGQAAIHAAPLATTPVSQLDFADRVTDENRRELILVCELWRNDQRMALTVTPLVPDKHLRLEEAQVEVQLQTAGTKLSILLRAHTLARFVELSFKDTDVVFSDNYFDLPAHASLAVTCSLPEGWTLDQSRQALRIRSLADSH